MWSGESPSSPPAGTAAERKPCAERSSTGLMRKSPSTSRPAAAAA